MGDTLSGAVATSAFLAFVALPVSILVTNGLFFPDPRAWNWRYSVAMLRAHGVALLALLAMLIPQNIQAAIDPAFTAALPWRDAPTAFIAAYEGGFHEWLQAIPGRAILQPTLAFVYLVGFPYIIISTTAISVWRNDGVRARRAATAYALCYAFALPFYLFLPVNEVWFHLDPANGGSVQQLALHYPIVRESLYAFNEINNCFPSLHTGISVAMALVARGVPRFGTFAAVWASLIVFSTMYLGIHWVTDVVAGIVLAILMVRLAKRIWPDAPIAAPGNS